MNPYWRAPTVTKAASLWARCDDCDVRWRGTSPCWVCGKVAKSSGGPALTSQHSLSGPNSVPTAGTITDPDHPHP